MYVNMSDRLNFKEYAERRHNAGSSGEDDAKYGMTRTIQTEDNLDGNNIDNAVCLPNVDGGTLLMDDKEDTVLGVSSKRD